MHKSQRVAALVSSGFRQGIGVLLRGQLIREGVRERALQCAIDVDVGVGIEILIHGLGQAEVSLRHVVVVAVSDCCRHLVDVVDAVISRDHLRMAKQAHTRFR